MSDKKKPGFIRDPFVREAIKMFKTVDKDLPHFLKAVTDRDELRKLVGGIREFGRILHDDNRSMDFREATRNEGIRLLKSAYRLLPQNADEVTREMRRTALGKALRNRGVVIERETKIVLYIWSLPRYGVVDLIAPAGNTTNWPLNVLICCLVEHCKESYPSENHFSLIARIFGSSSFSISGWKKSRRSPRQKIADRYAEMQQDNYDTRTIYNEVKKILLS